MRRHLAGNRVRLKHIKRVTKPNGRIFLYLAVPGHKLMPLPNMDIDSPEFLAAYSAALQKAPKMKLGVPTAEGSIDAAMIAYQRSDAFQHLSDSTRAMRRPILSKIGERWGKARLKDLKEKHIAGDVASCSGHAAVNRLKAWRGFCAWAKGMRMIDDDISAKIDRPKTARSEGHKAWTPAEVEMFREYWPLPTPQRLSMELLFWTAARASDAIRLGPGMIDKAGWLSFRQQKTGGEVSIPFNRDLPRFAEGMQRDLDHLKAAIATGPKHATWVVTMYGKPRSIKAFTQWFSQAASDAGLPQNTAHGLRKARATALAEAGATVHQIAAWTGHATLAEVERYARSAEKKRLLSGST